MSCFSQEDAWIYFKDKPNSAVFLSNPLTMLTQRALDRRTNQGISLDITDVPVYQPYIDEVMMSPGIIVKAKSKWLNCLHVRASQSEINALKLVPSVSKVEFANRLLTVARKSDVVTNSTVITKNRQTVINYNYGSSTNQIQMLNGNLLHQLNYTGSGKIIAVLDAGFIGVDTAVPFKRLRDNNQILGGYNFVNKSNSIYTNDSHGTNVLSTMGGFVDGQLVGTAPDASYYLFVTEDAVSAYPYNENPVEESYWVEAAEEADRLGVDIITTSLGYFGYNNPAYSHTYVDMTGNSAFVSRGANIAFSKGIIVVASAGNEGATSEPHIGVPAEATNVIAVGAVNATKNYTSFSSIGPSYDNRIKPDIMAQGVSVVLSDASGNIGTANGTSFSCPITAGLIACLWQALPTKSNAQIKKLITESADRFSNPTPQYGYGIPDFNLAFNTSLSATDHLYNEFIVYPNPTFDSISVNSNKESLRKIVIYSELGQQVLQEQFLTKTATISLETLNSGIYFYKIESNGSTQTGKIIKQ